MRDTNGDLRHGHEGARHRTSTAGVKGRVEEQREQLLLGARQLDAHRRTAMSTSAARTASSRCARRSSRGEWGVTQDDAGRIYRNTNESALHVDFVPTPYFARNPNLLRTRGSYEAARERQRRPEHRLAGPPESGHQPRVSDRHRSPGRTLARFTAVCAPLVYRGDRLPARALRQRVRRRARGQPRRAGSSLSDDGTTLRARKAYDNGEFLASTDERFRPVYLSNAPDGTLYIVDMYRGVIQHASSTHRVPARSHRRAQARGAGRARPHLSRRARDDAGATRESRSPRRRRHSWWRRCRTRTAGGATRRSGCSSSAARRRSCRRS